MTLAQKDRGRRMICSHRCLGYLSILLQIIICSLLIYALIITGGDIVVSGCQKIGFYNFCLYNKTTEDCQCITHIEDLNVPGRINQHELVLAIFLTYLSLVTVAVGILTMIMAVYTYDSDLWKCAQGLNVLSLIGLSLGMITYVFLIWDLFDISHVTPGFLAVLTALSGMLLLCFIIASGDVGR